MMLIKDTAALKFFRQCIGLQDEFYNKQMTQHRLFEPILNIVYETMPRDNLLNSACLEFFETITRENYKALTNHLVENYRSRLEEITYVNTFQKIVLRYDQTHDPNQTFAESDATLFSNEESRTPGRAPNINGNQRWQGVGEMDAREEAYFNTSDDEDESPNSKKEKRESPVTNGVATSPMLRSLVDYPDDDDDTIEIKAEPEPSEPGADPKLSPSPVLQTPPPERLSEKRRREEDNEEDELGKLSIPKRRNSGSSVSSGGSFSGNNTLRRKKGFASRDNGRSPSAGGGKGAKKIEISLAAKPQSSETESNQDDGG